MYQPGQDIAALVVRAEQVAFAAGRQKPRPGKVSDDRRVRRERIGKDRNEYERQQNAKAEHRKPVGGETPPGHIGAAEPSLGPRLRTI